MTETAEDLQSTSYDPQGDAPEPLTGEVLDPIGADLDLADDEDDDGDLSLEPYATKKAAQRKRNQLIQKEAKLQRDYVIWVLRDGPTLCGYKTPAAAISDIKQVAKSQAYREVTLATVTQKLAAASRQPGERGISAILQIDGFNAKSAEGLKKHVGAMVGEIERRAETAHNDDEVLTKIVPEVVGTFLDRTKATDDHQSEDEHPEDDLAESAANSDTAAALSSDTDPRITENAELVTCPHCNGTGVVARADAE